MATQSETPPQAPGDSTDFAQNPLSPSKSPLSASSDESPTDLADADSGSTAPRLPSLRAISEQTTASNMTSSSTPLGMLNNARRPGPAPSLSSKRAGGGLPQDMLEKMKAFHQSRQGTPPNRSTMSPVGPGSPAPNGVGLSAIGGLPGGRVPAGMRPPPPQGFPSAPAVPKTGAKPSLSARRNMPKLGGLPGALPSSEAAGLPKLSLNGVNSPVTNGNSGSAFNQFSHIVDLKKGTLNLAGKAVIHGQGIDFSGGSNFSISLDEVDTMEELGKGNYGTVYKVRHARPRMRRPGLGLAGNKSSPTTAQEKDESVAPSPITKGTTGVIMAMKEIRLELDEAKFGAIIMELDILHRCVSPYIIEFYGAFFQEGAVYICIEFMDGGSIDKIYGDGVPENVLRKIAYGTIRGLKELKDVHNIIHRDVKPTNILVNTRGQIKICDFGVSGNLVASIAKTNIGCQSYMAPERISGGGGLAQAGGTLGTAGTYSAQSDVWSVGLSLIECAMGRYPYPPETYNNIFSQLSAIVDGDPPDLPGEGYSPVARDFVHRCLNKVPKLRPTYSMLLAHSWLSSLSKPDSISEEEEVSDDLAALSLEGKNQPTGENTFDAEVATWCKNALERKRSGKMGVSEKPALHNAPLDAVSPASSPAT